MKPVASVLFSGGTDSTLAAARALDEFQRVVLLTFDPGYVLFVRNSKVHAEALAAKYGADRVRHEILDARDAAAAVLWKEVRRDLARYDFSMTSLVCLGCRMAMHARLIAYNLEHRIPWFVDGSVAQQANIPEQMEETLEAHREVYFERFGIGHSSPIYAERHSDHEVHRLGLQAKRDLKKQFIFFDTQATCVFGVPADVHSRLFYGRLQPGLRERESTTYRAEKYPAMFAFVERTLAAKGLDADELVAELRALRGGAEPDGSDRAASANPGVAGEP